jgi:hypothetical protein
VRRALTEPLPKRNMTEVHALAQQGCVQLIGTVPHGLAPNPGQPRCPGPIAPHNLPILIAEAAEKVADKLAGTLSRSPSVTPRSDRAPHNLPATSPDRRGCREGCAPTLWDTSVAVQRSLGQRR